MLVAGSPCLGHDHYSQQQVCLPPLSTVGTRESGPGSLLKLSWQDSLKCSQFMRSSLKILHSSYVSKQSYYIQIDFSEFSAKMKAKALLESQLCSTRPYGQNQAPCVKKSRMHQMGSICSGGHSFVGKQTHKPLGVVGCDGNWVDAVNQVLWGCRELLTSSWRSGRLLSKAILESEYCFTRSTQLGLLPMHLDRE